MRVSRMHGRNRPGWESCRRNLPYQSGEPRWPRYDPNQTPAERYGYDNMIILCSTHHTVIDDDEEAYTVERLVKMKTDH